MLNPPSSHLDYQLPFLIHVSVLPVDFSTLNPTIQQRQQYKAWLLIDCVCFLLHKSRVWHLFSEAWRSADNQVTVPWRLLGTEWLAAGLAGFQQSCPAWVMLQQVHPKCFPASTNTHHNMLIIQHLKRERERERNNISYMYIGMLYLSIFFVYIYICPNTWPDICECWPPKNSLC